jgi:hypothetical protein
MRVHQDYWQVGLLGLLIVLSVIIVIAGHCGG